jgi:hypothetical protein
VLKYIVVQTCVLSVVHECVLCVSHVVTILPDSIALSLI